MDCPLNSIGYADWTRRPSKASRSLDYLWFDANAQSVIDSLQSRMVVEWNHLRINTSSFLNWYKIFRSQPSTHTRLTTPEDMVGGDTVHKSPPNKACAPMHRLNIWWRMEPTLLHQFLKITILFQEPVPVLWCGCINFHWFLLNGMLKA